MSPGRELFQELVSAAQKADGDRLSALREHWKEIAAYIEKHPAEADAIQLPAEQQETLILWLSTSPAPEAIGWNELRKPHVVVERRQQQVALVEQLWAAWQTEKILEQVRQAARPLAQGEAWTALTRRCYQQRPKEMSQAADNQDFHLQVIAGYAAALDQHLLRQHGYPWKAWVSVQPGDQELVLMTPDHQRLGEDALAQGIAFRSGAAAAPASWLARAITLSLPAHRSVLPNVAVDLERGQCRLVPAPEDPLRELAKGEG